MGAFARDCHFVPSLGLPVDSNPERGIFDGLQALDMQRRKRRKARAIIPQDKCKPPTKLPGWHHACQRASSQFRFHVVSAL